MIVYSLWGLRKGESLPELMAAWDEYSVDSYSEGWRESCEKAIASWGADLVESRYVRIQVPGIAIENAFAPIDVDGVVVPDG